jgi:AcrR family transcriptional regulator
MHAESREIWDLPERGTRGPRPRHDRAAIAAAAIAIADAEGPAALTMRTVARRLGIATMSLYNYVPTKDHLIQLMIDQLTGEHVLPQVSAGATAAARRAAIAGIARQARDIARRHPWLPVLLHRPPVPGPNGLRYLDCFLGLLADSGLDTGARLEMIALITGFATAYGAMQASAEGPATSASAQVLAFAQAAASGQYPSLAAALAEAGPARGDQDIFESCVARLIDAARPSDRAGRAAPGRDQVS